MGRSGWISFTLKFISDTYCCRTAGTGTDAAKRDSYLWASCIASNYQDGCVDRIVKTLRTTCRIGNHASQQHTLLKRSSRGRQDTDSRNPATQLEPCSLRDHMN